MMDYPKLYYPEMYLLKGGYREFYSRYKERLGLPGYVEMNDATHKEAYKKEMTKRSFRKCYSEGFLR